MSIVSLSSCGTRGVLHGEFMFANEQRPLVRAFYRERDVGSVTDVELRNNSFSKIADEAMSQRHV